MMDIVQYDMSAFRDGNPTIFKLVYQNYHQPLLYYTRKQIGDRHEVQDIVADTFQKLWEHRAKITDSIHLKGFLFRVTLNSCINFNKQKVFRSAALPDLLQPDNGHDRQFHKDIFKTDVYAMLASRINSSLSKTQRLVMTECWINGRSEEEISALHGMTINNIRVVKSQAIERLNLKASDILLLILTGMICSN